MHALPYLDALPAIYEYPDGCRVRKWGDGSCSLVAAVAHSEADFTTHPDNPQPLLLEDRAE